jgi:hypothetical protein
VLFSIVTPSYRGSPWLGLCIASVADQGVEVEHIVQDAGSDDGTLEWLPRDPRVRAFVEKDRGMYDAINRGLRRSRGEVLGWLNCDEQYLPGALAMVRTFFEKHPGVDVVFGDVVMVDEQGEYLCHRKMQPPLLYHTWTCHLSTLSCATFFRRRVFFERGFTLDERWKMAGDGEWMVRMLRAGVSMATLGRFTSVFALTGKNLGLGDRAAAENRALRETAPRWIRLLRPLWVAHHRLRRLLGGMYVQEPFQFELFTLDQPDRRRRREVIRHCFSIP